MEANLTFRTSIGFVNAVANAPENAPDAIFTKKFVDPNVKSQIYLVGSYKLKRRPP